MPNHVEQDLWVTGNTETLKEFMAFAKDGDKLLSADKFIPYPKEYKDKDEEGERLRAECAASNDWTKYTGYRDGFNSGGYEWCVQNWGTKWGIYDAQLLLERFSKKSGKLKYTCQSAWSPAIPVIEAMSKKFPTLKFQMKYYEQGMQFRGNFIAQNGEVVLHETAKYSGRRGG
jgi:hypothetical protein